MYELFFMKFYFIYMSEVAVCSDEINAWCFFFLLFGG